MSRYRIVHLGEERGNLETDDELLRKTISNEIWYMGYSLVPLLDEPEVSDEA
jgi:hypothetical protein